MTVQTGTASAATDATSLSNSRRVVVGLLMSIGAFDVVNGLRMLLGPTPWLQNWQERSWLGLPDVVRTNAAMVPFVIALYRRIGALWFHAGVVTLAWAWLSRRSGRSLVALMATYTVSGMGILWCDQTFAAGTDWLALKRVFAAAWTVAMVLHARDYWREVRAAK